jgi:hypothetical protein
MVDLIFAFQKIKTRQKFSKKRGGKSLKENKFSPIFLLTSTITFKPAL